MKNNNNNNRSNDRQLRMQNYRNGSHSDDIYTNGLRRSTRNWNLEKSKLNEVEHLPLISRRDDTNDDSSLRNPYIQKKLWHSLQNKLSHEEDSSDKKYWSDIILQFRKLREAVFATISITKDYPFIVEVFENSVTACLKANNNEELFKSFSRLIQEIYTKKPAIEKPFYTALYVLYLKCVKRDDLQVLKSKNRLDLDNCYGDYVFRLLKAMENPIVYFKLRDQAPSSEYDIVLSYHDDTMRVHALNTMRKAYLSSSIDWVKVWLGFAYQNKNIKEEIERLQQGDCIKSINYETHTIYFNKKKLAY